MFLSTGMINMIFVFLPTEYITAMPMKAVNTGTSTTTAIFKPGIQLFLIIIQVLKSDNSFQRLKTWNLFQIWIKECNGTQVMLLTYL